jgi:hypothetical protein
MKNILILILSLLLSSCGFKRLNENNTELIYFKNINIVGEQRIAYTLKNNILIISKENSKNKYNAEITVQQQKSDKTKNKAGKITRYNLSVSAQLVLTNLDNNKKVQKSFTRDRDYLVAENHSETISNEKNATKNIVQRVSDDIITFITLMMREK